MYISIPQEYWDCSFVEASDAFFFKKDAQYVTKAAWVSTLWCGLQSALEDIGRDGNNPVGDSG